MHNQPMNEPMDHGEEPLLLPVPEAGKRAGNWGRNTSYRAANTGEMPTVKIGGRKFCAWRRWKRMLEGEGTPSPPA